MAACEQTFWNCTHDIPVVSLLFAVWPSDASAMCAYADVYASACNLLRSAYASAVHMQMQCICVCMWYAGALQMYVQGAQWAQSRLGTYCPDQNRPRLIRVLFKSMDDKHTFLKHAKHLKEVNLRYDDDLTTLQQKQRQDMSADFDTLKSKGHNPFYRGSSLKFRHADKTRTCRRHGANRAPDAQV